MRPGRLLPSLLSSIVLLIGSSLQARVIFDPPNPSSTMSVTAHVPVPSGICAPTNTSVERHGRIISISSDYPPCTIPAAPFVDMPVSLGVLPAGVYDVVVGQKQLLIGLDEGWLVVSDDSRRFDVVPNTIPVTGGQVTLRSRTVENLYGCATGPSPIICDQYRVVIDGQPATVVNSPSYREIVVNAPPHAAGVVDVSIIHGDDTAATATAALEYVQPGAAPDAAFFEPVIFPTLLSGPGAFGSQWRSDVAMQNDNDLTLAAASTLFGDASPHSTLTVTGANAPAGTILFVPRDLAAGLSFDALVRDLSRQSEAYGTEIPVVREKDLLGHPFNILLVPAEAKYRTALRVLRIDGGTTVHLRICGSDSNALVDTDLQLQAASSTYASLNISDLVATYPQLAGKSPLRVQIDPGTTVRGTWAFVSVTNNATQNVTIVTPH